MNQTTVDKWMEIQRGPRYEYTTPAELAKIFERYIPRGSTVLRERFEQNSGEVVEKPPLTLANFRSSLMGDNNVNIMWDMGKGYNFKSFKGEQKVVIQEHDDGRKSIIIGRDSNKRPGVKITNRYTVVLSN